MKNAASEKQRLPVISSHWMIVALLFGLFTVSLSWSATFMAPLEEKPGTLFHKIKVTASGRLEIGFSRTNGFGQTVYDLKSDPEKKLDLAPIFTGGAYYSGLFWVKIGRASGAGASWETNPPESLKVLESNPARIRIQSKGKHTRYGTGHSPWENVGYDQIYTMYPNGSVYVSYVLEATVADSFLEMAVITRSTGKWSTEGNGTKEVQPMAEFGVASPYPRVPTAWHLQWSIGPTYFTDILMVAKTGKYVHNYYGFGYVDGNGVAQDYRTSFRIYGLPGAAGGVIPAGRTPLQFLLRFADNINDAAAANLISNDYRTPDVLTFTEGQAVKSDPGDTDLDGYNEGEGCYVMNAGTKGVSFTLHGTATKRAEPAFKIKGWNWAAPTTITLGGASLANGTDFNAAYSGEVLILQILRTITTDAAVSVVGSGTPPAIKTSLMIPKANAETKNFRMFDISGRQISFQRSFPGASALPAVHGVWIGENGKRFTFSGKGD